MDRKRETAESLIALDTLLVLMGGMSEFCACVLNPKAKNLLNEQARKYLYFFCDNAFVALTEGVADAVQLLRDEQIAMGDVPPKKGGKADAA